MMVPRFHIGCSFVRFVFTGALAFHRASEDATKYAIRRPMIRQGEV
jgi:hypothetical protein